METNSIDLNKSKKLLIERSSILADMFLNVAVENSESNSEFA